MQALRMSSKARQNCTVGEIVNLMSVDAQRLMDVVTYLYAIYTTPIQITLALILLYKYLGPSVFAGFGIMVLLIPLNFVVAGQGRRYQVCMSVELIGQIFRCFESSHLFSLTFPIKGAFYYFITSWCRVLIESFGVQIT